MLNVFVTQTSKDGVNYNGLECPNSCEILSTFLDVQIKCAGIATAVFSALWNYLAIVHRASEIESPITNSTRPIDLGNVTKRIQCHFLNQITDEYKRHHIPACDKWVHISTSTYFVLIPCYTQEPIVSMVAVLSSYAGYTGGQSNLIRWGRWLRGCRRGDHPS